MCICVAYVMELVFLILSVPGQGAFIHSLWSGKYRLPSLSGPTFSFDKVLLLLYLLPTSFLPQFSNSFATSVIGSIGIFSFSLTVITNSNLNFFWCYQCVYWIWIQNVQENMTYTSPWLKLYVLLKRAVELEVIKLQVNCNSSSTICSVEGGRAFPSHKSRGGGGGAGPHITLY